MMQRVAIESSVREGSTWRVCPGELLHGAAHLGATPAKVGSRSNCHDRAGKVLGAGAHTARTECKTKAGIRLRLSPADWKRIQARFRRVPVGKDWIVVPTGRSQGPKG